jgi:RNA polymerase sigma-70 factor (ECF subfamily)
MRLAIKVSAQVRLSLEMGSIEQLYRDRFEGFRNALAPIVGSIETARDVVQEAFAVALREQRKLRRDESLAPWVWRIAYRLALHERARNGETELLADMSILDEERDPALAAAIRTLPPQRRLVLFLRYFADFSYSDIALALDISEGTVAATLTQARAALLQELTPKEVAQ